MLAVEELGWIEQYTALQWKHYPFSKELPFSRLISGLVFFWFRFVFGLLSHWLNHTHGRMPVCQPLSNRQEHELRHLRSWNTSSWFSPTLAVVSGHCLAVGFLQEAWSPWRHFTLYHNYMMHPDGRSHPFPQVLGLKPLPQANSTPSQSLLEPGVSSTVWIRAASEQPGFTASPICKGREWLPFCHHHKVLENKCPSDVILSMHPAAPTLP